MPRRVFLVFALTVGTPLTSAAQADPREKQAMEAIRPEAIRAHMRFLADDLLEGRATATRGHLLAARYVATRFEALGLEPTGTDGTYFQTVPFHKITTLAERSSMALLRDGSRTELKYGTEFLISGAGLTQSDVEVTAPLVYAGFGVQAPELGYDDYAGLDVQGKIVVLLPGAPPTFPSEQRAYYSVNQFKSLRALDRGAVGVIVLLTPRELLRTPWEALVGYRRIPDYQWLEGGLPFRADPRSRGLGVLNLKVAESLFGGAQHSWDEVLKASEDGKPLSFPLPLAASLHTVSEREPVESPNVAALLRGSDPKLRDEVFVVSAHLDHLGIGEPVDGDAIYNGAYDNASGIAAILEMAQAFTRLPEPPRRSILFLAFTGEERGLQGSEFFVHHPTVPRDRIVANLNIDMFLMLHPLRDVIAYGAEHSTLGTLAERSARDLGIAMAPDPFPEQVVFIRSDQFPFIHQGIPALLLSSGFGDPPSPEAPPEELSWFLSKYHKPGDDMNQTFDWEAGVKFVQLNFLVAYRAAQAELAPRWNPGDFFAPKGATALGR